MCDDILFFFLLQKCPNVQVQLLICVCVCVCVCLCMRASMWECVLTLNYRFNKKREREKIMKYGIIAKDRRKNMRGKEIAQDK